MLVVDDALPLRVLGGVADAAVMAELERGELFTTGVWYHRLSRAVHDDRSLGNLSRELAAFDQDVQHQILESLDQLPDRIGLLGWRRLVPVMAVLNIGRNPNLLPPRRSPSLSWSAPTSASRPTPRWCARERPHSASAIESSASDRSDTARMIQAGVPGSMASIAVSGRDALAGQRLGHREMQVRDSFPVVLGIQRATRRGCKRVQGALVARTSRRAAATSSRCTQS